MINTDEHVITNPVERLASQGLSVDWFRFWLQGYEDPDPAKTEQYKRWRELRALQAENEKKAASESARSSWALPSAIPHQHLRKYSKENLALPPAMAGMVSTWKTALSRVLSRPT